MDDVIEDVLSLNIEPHLNKLDYLVLAASNPDERYIEEGVERISELVRKVNEKHSIRFIKNPILKSNKLAAFFNYEPGFPLDSEKRTDDVYEVVKSLLDEEKNLSSSLSVTMLHNIIAYKFNLGGNFRVFSQGSEYFAPYFKADNCEYSIFLHNGDNNRKPFQFKNAEVINNLEAISELAKRTSNSQIESLKRIYLENLSKKLLDLKDVNLDFKEIPEYVEYRIRKGLSQQQVADMIGKLRRSYSSYELGDSKPSDNIDRKIREVLDMELKPSLILGAVNTQIPRKKQIFPESKKLGEFYREVRLRSGISQKEVAEKLGVPVGTYGNYEAGYIKNIPLEIDKKIRDFFKLDHVEESKPVEKKEEHHVEGKKKEIKSYTLENISKEGEYRVHRENLGFSQRDVASRIGISKISYHRYEARIRTPPIDVDKKIRYFLKMPIEFNSVGEEYKFYRGMKGLSQVEVAEKIGKGKSTYAYYEIGNFNPPENTDKDIRYVLGMPMNFDSIGKEYKFYRAKKGVSQDEVAAAIGKARRTYTDYELNIHNPDSLTDKKIREFLDIKNDFGKSLIE